MDRGRWYRLERYYPDEELDEELDEDEEMNGNEEDIQPAPLAQQVEGVHLNQPLHPGARRHPEYAGAVNPGEGRLAMGMVPGGFLIPVLVPADAPVPAPAQVQVQVQVPNPEPIPKLRNRHLIENLQELIREAGAGQNGELAGRMGEVSEDEDEEDVPQVPRVVARNGDERDARGRDGMMWEMAEMAEMYRVRNAERMRARGVEPHRQFGDERDGLGGDREEFGNLARRGAEEMGDEDGEGQGEGGGEGDPLKYVRQLRERYGYGSGGEDGEEGWNGNGNGNAYGNQNQNLLLPNPVVRNGDVDVIADAAAERERGREMERIRDEEREIHENARRFYERYRLRGENGIGNGNRDGDENYNNQFPNYPPQPQLRPQSPVAGPPRLEIGDLGEIRGIVENFPAPAPPVPPAPFRYQPENRLGRRADLVDGGVNAFGGAGAGAGGGQVQGAGRGVEARYPPLGRIEYGVWRPMHFPPDFDWDQSAGWREIKRRREMIKGIPMPEEDVFSDEEGGVDGKGEGK
ncbi:hypothetical protein BOTNAR_0348g00120 [Botryotinia narcissicola]|uniref:Uncharacterized protein n=1 Tax=Botryotinia narcissicola TaxID=278944 RepID=A0A4Z1HRG3_9HELO|nr:hypothetical protein BOTNAR_0348g00120 [Botryotinia narcissicola]